MTRFLLTAISGFMAGTMMFSPFASYLRRTEAVTETAETTETDEASALDEAIREYLPGIVCWGDSLTVGACGDGVTFPRILKQRLTALGLRNKVDVINAGVGGESSATIATRSGAYELCAHEFTIPADTEPVELRFYSMVRYVTYPLIQGDGYFNPVTIAGVKGTIDSTHDAYLSRNKYYFTRSEPGEEVKVEKGTPIVTYASENFRDYLNIVFIGTNGGYTGTGTLIKQQKAILERSTGQKDRYLVIGLFEKSVEKVSVETFMEYEAKMAEEYGDRFINLREYLITDGLKDAGIEPTEEDLERIGQGLVPPSLMDDDLLHLNATGYALLGNLIFDRMEQLGYFDEIKAAMN